MDVNDSPTNQDGPSLTREFDIKQPRGSTNLARKICVVLGNNDLNRPILTITRTVHSLI